MSGLGTLVKTGKGARKGEPFYSAVDEAAAALTRGKGTGKEFMTELEKTKGVKLTEIKDRGLDKIKTMPKITKEEFLAELEKRPAQQVEEKVLLEPTKKDIEARANEMAYEDAMDELRAEGMNRHEAADVAAEMAEDRIDDYIERATEELSLSNDAPAHGNFVIKGGENYREMLLKMPSFKGDKKIMELEAQRRRVDPEFHSYRYKDLTEQIDALKAEKAAMPEQFKGDPRHFGGEPGILASVRVLDRKGPNGEKVLHVEEIQSDWHQAGRKKGYRGDQKKTDWDDPEYVAARNRSMELNNEFNRNSHRPDRQAEIRPAMEEASELVRSFSDRNNKIGSLVPDAPFKKNWHELAMKRVLNYAAENGYDRVAITPGVEQADRYNLAKYIDEINYGKNPDGTYSLAATDKKGKVALNETSLSEDELESMIGKDMAQKIVSGEGKEFPVGSVSEGKRSLSGLDLEIGGEGMKGFYDKMLPDYLNSYGKKYGVQVSPFDVETKPSEGFQVRDTTNPDSRPTRFMSATDAANWRSANNYPDTYVIEPQPSEKSTLHSFDITPEMRQEITGKGMPLYQQIGIPTGGAAAGMGALEQEDQGFKKGGKIKKRGQVKFASNPDTMWLELMSRS
jgi:hypothetical protein